MPDKLDLIVQANLCEMIQDHKPLDELINTLDELAKNYDSELGLPRYDNGATAQMRLIILKWIVNNQRKTQ